MFLVEAIADFGPEVMNEQQQQQPASSHNNETHDPARIAQREERARRRAQGEFVSDHESDDEEEPHKSINQVIQSSGRNNPNKQQARQSEQSQKSNNQQNRNEQQQQQQESSQNLLKRKREDEHQQQIDQSSETPAIKYLSFKKGDKILVRNAYENGWWFGNVLKHSDVQGYFPSTFVKVGVGAPLPQVKPPAPEEQAEEGADEPDWISKKLKQIDEAEDVPKGPMNSEYYQGIKGYKMVRVDDKNKNILKGNYIKFDTHTGLASIPIKSQDPTSKAVRQMGYYFDYHQWCEERNRNPEQRAAPDASRKKKKKLNLKLFGEDRVRQEQNRRG